MAGVSKSGENHEERARGVDMRTVHEVEYANTDAEYREICDFLDDLGKQDPFAHWESGRMGYWRHSLHGGKGPQNGFFRDNVRIWREAGTGIVGLCISEYGRDDLFVEVLPAWRELYPDIFHWIECTWAASRDVVEIDVFADDAEKIGLLVGEGYAFLRHFENKRTYDLDRIDLDYSLEPGFSIRTYSEADDFNGRLALVRNAFDNPDYTEERLEGLISSPEHMDEWDLMVLAPDGTPVSYCVGWRARVRDDAGLVEPVGTHAEYRRRGFAQAVIRECFTRMKADGIRTVEIASRAEPVVANFLYDSLNPTAKREVHKYEKRMAPLPHRD
jgi:ribosomal protein S18 acetylase RimI-like enzyme